MAGKAAASQQAAGAKGGSGSGNGAQPSTPAMSGPPSGFRRQSSVSDAPWVEQKEGNVCFGKLINRYPMNNQDPPRYYYQVELKTPCLVRIGRGDDAEVKEAKVGEVVNLNENYKSSCLRDQVIPEIIAGAEYEVWAKFESKISLQGGRTMWNIDVHTKQLKPPTSAIRPLTDEGAPAEDSPF